MLSKNRKGAVLVVAGSYSQAIYWAQQWKLDKWIYASDIDSTRGWIPSEIRYCGTCMTQPQKLLNEIEYVVKPRMERK